MGSGNHCRPLTWFQGNTFLGFCPRDPRQPPPYCGTRTIRTSVVSPWKKTSLGKHVSVIMLLHQRKQLQRNLFCMCYGMQGPHSRKKSSENSWIMIHSARLPRVWEQADRAYTHTSNAFKQRATISKCANKFFSLSTKGPRV